MGGLGLDGLAYAEWRRRVAIVWWLCVLGAGAVSALVAMEVLVLATLLGQAR